MNLYTNLAVERLGRILNTDRGNSKYGLIFHLSGLKETHKSQEQINIAANVLKDQLQGVNGDVFVLEKADIVVVIKSCSMRQIKNAVFQMRYLFADDPLAYSNHNQANDNFCSAYSFDTEWKQFVTDCQDMLKAHTIDSISTEQTHHTDIFSTVEAILDKANFNKFLEINPICLITPRRESTAKLIISEIFFQRDVILSYLKESHPLLNSSHLANLLFSFAEVRMLIKLLEMARALTDKAFLLTLSINTINSEDFKIFDTALDERLKKNIIFSFPLHDVFADYELFKKISSELKEKGYKTSISGMFSEWLGKLNIDFLSADFIKVDYKDFCDSTEQLPLMDQQSKKVLSVKPQNLIATGVDDSAKFEKLRKSGIILFQGRYMNELLGV